MADDKLTERELRAWRTSIRMLELLRSRLEQQLQASSGLSLADYSVLASLSEAPEGRMRVYELGQAAGWEKSRLHHQLKRMASRGLVDRQPCGSRGIDAVLTAKGRAAIEQAAPSHAREVRHLFVNRLSAEQLDQFAQLAGIILKHLETGR